MPANFIVDGSIRNWQNPSGEQLAYSKVLKTIPLIGLEIPSEGIIR